MHSTLQWHTQTGGITPDNRDVYAHIELADASLYLIADGSSSRPYSRELATALLAGIALDFSQLPTAGLSPQQVADAVLQSIANSHQRLRETHSQGACSYLALCLLAGTAFSIHEGDCCLGLIDQSGKISWLSRPHCTANWQGNLTHAEISLNPTRHQLTRCFRARRAGDPELNHWAFAPNQHWLLASDGFWAGLNMQQQLNFLRDGSLLAPPTDDDISCLSIIIPPT